MNPDQPRTESSTSGQGSWVTRWDKFFVRRPYLALITFFLISLAILLPFHLWVFEETSLDETLAAAFIIGGLQGSFYAGRKYELKKH